MKQMETAATLVLGIGNTLLTDEGTGIHALQQLQLEYPDIQNTLFLDGGTLSFTLASWIEDCENLLVFDAAEIKQPPGTVCCLQGSEMDSFLGASRRSAHEVGLLDLMDIARLTESLPENRALIGIQPESFGWSMQPSEAVQKALPEATRLAAELISRWNADLRQADGVSKYNSSSRGAQLDA